MTTAATTTKVTTNAISPIVSCPAALTICQNGGQCLILNGVNLICGIKACLNYFKSFFFLIIIHSLFLQAV